MLDLNVIYNEDGLKGMERIPAGSIDCVICNLPYGGINSGNALSFWNRQIPLAPLWKHYERVVKPNGAIILFGSGMFTSDLMQSNRKMWRYNLVWNKERTSGFLNANRMPLRQHEDILVFYKHLPVYHPQFTQGQPNHPQGDGPHKDTNRVYGKLKARPKREKTTDKYPTSIISVPAERDSDLSAMQKPVDLIRYLVRTYTDEGDVVLDNCIGCGSTAMACLLENRKFVGFEANPENYKKAQRRVDEFVGPFKMF